MQKISPQTAHSKLIKPCLTRRTVLLGLVGMVGLGASRAQVATDPSGLPLILAENAPSGLSPAGYWVSEKWDGVRAIWDGKVLRFRSGRVIAAPPWFTAKLPAVALDGELWVGRGRFDVLSGIVRKAVAVDEAWRGMTYGVFELPGAAPKSTFSERSAALKTWVDTAAWSQLQWVEQSQVANAIDLQAKLAAVVAAGGEGLMLHWGDAPLIDARSPWLLKLKPRFDAQARVLAHIAGKGKFAGDLGALRVQTEAGVRFKLGTGFSAAQRRAPPAVGSTVVFSYRDVTPSGVPRFASFLRVHEAE